MHVEYKLDLRGMLPLLQRWNLADLPNRHEKWRNDEIEKLQGIRNRFIDDRALSFSDPWSGVQPLPGVNLTSLDIQRFDKLSRLTWVPDYGTLVCNVD
jgi:hypothetical protein